MVVLIFACWVVLDDLRRLKYHTWPSAPRYKIMLPRFKRRATIPVG